MIDARAWCVILAGLTALAGCATVPEPLTGPEIATRAASDKRLLKQTVVPVDRALTFSEAAAHALANNLDIRSASLDAVLARGQVDLADLQKLPGLVRNAGYTWRDPPGNAADKVPGDQVRRTFSTELSWNILDFGVSYVRAKQEANNVLIAEERKRRTANTIVNDVRLAYWQSLLAAQRLPQISAISAEIDAAMQQSRRLGELRLQDPLVALTYQEGLLDLQRQIKSYEAEAAQSKHRLARLLNAAPGQNIRLIAERRDDTIRALRKVDIDVIEDVALATRSELREQDYTARNRRIDVWAAYLQMLPTLRLRFANMFDSSTGLRNNGWYEEGYIGAWNILGIWQNYERSRQAGASLRSVDLRRLGLSMAVMEQARAAREQLGVIEEDYSLSLRTTEVRQQIWDIRRVRLPFAESDELERARAAVALVAAQIREDRAYASLQKSYGDLLASIGIDQYPDGIDLVSPAQAGLAIAQHLERLPAEVMSMAAAIAAAGKAAATPAARDIAVTPLVSPALSPALSPAAPPAVSPAGSPASAVKP